MIDTTTLRRTGLALALGLSLAACAQQPSPPAAQQTGGMSGMGMQGHSMSGMSGMQGHDMRGMNMQQMAAHCAQMRQQMRPGATMSPDMQAMISHCDQMHPQAGAAGTAPAAGQHRH
ncbi:hypothetical protein JYK14_08365 [Siccirubricoccus sp. KC 17139]|uniref:Uncharacterized protein n=1 Tax=Siccirubricoccus soli TaxID=2899147 RepID=A0ABT1D2P4_9PROT|nr:hypothetical protein [Siccirubricoccus soli]MCO6416180.1 hypothetical protein [Siccirubricoccus soli]MCP2682314.1 hypothetical protein [Siccirubricoccus soli]